MTDFFTVRVFNACYFLLLAGLDLYRPRFRDIPGTLLLLPV